MTIGRKNPLTCLSTEKALSRISLLRYRSLPAIQLACELFVVLALGATLPSTMWKSRHLCTVRFLCRPFGRAPTFKHSNSCVCEELSAVQLILAVLGTSGVARRRSPQRPCHARFRVFPNASASMTAVLCAVSVSK